MTTHVTNFVQPITQPLDGLHGHFSQLAARHRDANTTLRSHASELLNSNTTDTFKGDGAKALSGVVSYYINTSEKHMQTFDDAATSVKTCHTSVTDATDTASSAGLHDGLVHKVLSNVSHDDVIQQGGDSVWAVVNDLMSTLNDMKSTAGDFFGNVFSFHFGDAMGDLQHEWNDAGKVVGDVGNLLQDIGHVLGQWASTICSAVGQCLKFIGSAALGVLDFVTGFSSIINDVKTLFNGKASLLDKLLAAGDLILNVGMDVLMVTGIGEGLKAGELLGKGLLEGGQLLLKQLGEQGFKDFAKGMAEDAGKFLEQGTKDLVQKVVDGVDKLVGQGTNNLALSVVGNGDNLIGQGAKDFMRAAGDGIEQTGKKLVGQGGPEVFVNLYEGSGKQLLDGVLNLDKEEAFKKLDPVVQDVMKKTQQITSEQVGKIADYTKQVLNRGDTALKDLDVYKNAGPKLQSYLRRITRNPMSKNWRAAYGYAVEELSWDEMKKQGLKTAFNLEYNKTVPKGLQWLQSTTSRRARPDVLMDLFKNKWNAIDWTSTNYSSKILKYTSNQMEYLIEYLYK